MKTIKVDVYGMKKNSCKTTETDLTCIKFDGDRYTPSKNWIQVVCGDFESDSTYQYFKRPEVSVVKDGKHIFCGSFEELCKKLSQ